MQFRVSFASLITGVIILCMTLGLITTMILDLNTAADDDQMHSENLRIRSELDSMQVETRELQRQIELLQAYSLHIDISTEELEAQKPEKKPVKKLEKKGKKKRRKKSDKNSTSNIGSKPQIFIEVQKEEPPNAKSKNEIFIDVSSDENPPKKK